jgi:hypothetical protein
MTKLNKLFKVMKTRNLLIFLLLFLSVGALFGGGAFLLFPEGWMEMTPELMLQHSPFKNFLIPGLILFTVLGLMPIFVVWGLLKHKNCKIAQLVNIYPDMHLVMVLGSLHRLCSYYLDLYASLFLTRFSLAAFFLFFLWYFIVGSSVFKTCASAILYEKQVCQYLKKL